VLEQVTFQTKRALDILISSANSTASSITFFVSHHHHLIARIKQTNNTIGCNCKTGKLHVCFPLEKEKGERKMELAVL